MGEIHVGVLPRLQTRNEKEQPHFLREFKRNFRVNKMKLHEVWEGDHWQHVSSWDSLNGAEQEAVRLNEKFNGDYFVRKVTGSVVYQDRSRRM